MTIYRPEPDRRAQRTTRRRASRAQVTRVAPRTAGIDEETVFKFLGVAVLTSIALVAKLALLP